MLSPFARSGRVRRGVANRLTEPPRAAYWFAREAPPASNPGQRLAIICVVMALFAFTSNFTYALVGSLLRHWLAQGRRLLWFNRVLALVLAGTAAWMVTA